MHCTTTHTFPSTIAPITLLSPITINPDCLTTPAPHSHTHTFKQHSYMHSLRSLVLPWLTFPSVFPSVSICVLPGLLTLSPDRLLPAYWLASLSAACPDPLLCHWLRICLVYIALDTSVCYLPVWPPLCINKAADGSQRHWPVITEDFARTRIQQLFQRTLARYESTRPAARPETGEFAYWGIRHSVLRNISQGTVWWGCIKGHFSFWFMWAH